MAKKKSSANGLLFALMLSLLLMQADGAFGCGPERPPVKPEYSKPGKSNKRNRVFLQGVTGCLPTPPPAVRMPGPYGSMYSLDFVKPVYPPSALQAKLSGNVELQIAVDFDGSVRASRVVAGPPELHEAARDAVKQWKYVPYFFLNGERFKIQTGTTLSFNVSDNGVATVTHDGLLFWSDVKSKVQPDLQMAYESWRTAAPSSPQTWSSTGWIETDPSFPNGVKLTGWPVSDAPIQHIFGSRSFLGSVTVRIIVSGEQSEALSKLIASDFRPVAGPQDSHEFVGRLHFRELPFLAGMKEVTSIQFAE